jgi:hypothetical protein
MLTSLLLWRAQSGCTVLGFSSLYLLAEPTVNVEVWLVCESGQRTTGRATGAGNGVMRETVSC